MKKSVPTFIRLTVTAVASLIALYCLIQVWGYYMEAPWTRDGKIRADTIALAPDVSGRVTEVLVKDNQKVKKDEVLFRVDTARLKIALKRAEAAIVISKAGLTAAQYNPIEGEIEKGTMPNKSIEVKSSQKPSGEMQQG